jgi:hypothetical protein
MRYNRTFTELESKAVKWWPKELEATVAEASSLPKLIETQEKFISILILSGERPEQVFEVLAASAMPANLFLKHLVILADYGGELIKRLGREFNTIFLPESRGSRPVMHFMFRGEEQVYTFSTLPVPLPQNLWVKTGIIALRSGARFLEVVHNRPIREWV